jgi:hypothetical protein
VHCNFSVDGGYCRGDEGRNLLPWLAGCTLIISVCTVILAPTERLRLRIRLWASLYVLHPICTANLGWMKRILVGPSSVGFGTATLVDEDEMATHCYFNVHTTTSPRFSTPVLGRVWYNSNFTELNHQHRRP